MQPLPGEVRDIIGGRYRVESLLGKGGMGEVYAVIDGLHGPRRALKRLSPNSYAGIVELFQREYRTLSELRHPRIVEVFDYGVDENGAFYTMELLEGQDLSRAAPMPWRDVCACLRDAASILGVLHARRLVHRDLSPKNFWRTTDGRLKLLDFGALSAFGPSREIVGTPPFVAPEALRNQPLDQRTDLFALGALGYWLLTSTHAFRAASLGELPRLWEREPAAPSSMLKLLPQAVTDCPPELDRLLLSLLRQEPSERPRTTAEVIDTLNSIGELEHEAQDVVIRGYLGRRAFVGRARERDRFLACLRTAERGEPQTLFVEASEGNGRTHLLKELATAARFAGAVVVSAGASLEVRPYETASSLARALLTCRPDDARLLAEPHKGVLGRVSAELRDMLGVQQVAPPLEDARAERASKQEALFDWVLSLSCARTLVLLIDDMHRVDEESQALLATLARAPSGHRLLVVATASSDASFAGLAALHNLRAAAKRLRLLPFTPGESGEMLKSLFGETRYVDRLAARLHEISEGNPRHCLLLAQHLVHAGVIRYEEGAWALPQELPKAELPASMNAGFLARLNWLTPDARQLARLVSLPDHGSLPRELCQILFERDAEATNVALAELIAHHIAEENEHGLHVSHSTLRDSLFAELSADARARAHFTVGSWIEQQPGDELLAKLRAALHYLRANQTCHADALFLLALRRIIDGELEPLRAAAPLFAEALALLRASGHDEAAELAPLAALGLAGYLVDRSYAATYGDQALEAMQRALHLKLAWRLRPYLGAKLSLACALVVASIGLALKGRNRPQLLEVVRWLATAIGALCATAIICVDPAAIRRYTRVLKPFSALGPNHVVSFIQQINEAFALGAEEAPAEAQRRLLIAFERLQSPVPIIGLADALRAQYIAGFYVAYGHREVWKEGEGALRVADKLDPLGPVNAMQANQLRAMYHAAQGDLERAAHYTKLLEHQAIRFGSAWQAECYGPAVAARIGFWTHDAVAMKRTAYELLRLSAEMPTLVFYERMARACYCLLRDKPEETIAIWSTITEKPFAVAGWSRGSGVLAAAHNRLGEHQRARDICLEVLSHLTEADLVYVTANLNVPVELALANAGLGQLSEAKASLERLLDKHTPNQGPLVLGYLHHARARVALVENDFAAAQHHVEAMSRWYGGTRIPSLLDLVRRTRQELKHAERPEQGAGSLLFQDDLHLVTRVQLLMASTGVQTERLDKGLQVAVELTGADSAFMIVSGREDCAAQLGSEPPSSELIDWAQERLFAACAADETAVETVDALTDFNVKIVDKVQYCMTPLWTLRDGVDVPVAVLALGFEHDTPQLPKADILRIIAKYISNEAPEDGSASDFATAS